MLEDMLFNSYGYVFWFLPLVVIVFFTLKKLNLLTIGKLWLILASFYFYDYSKFRFIILFLLFLSIIANHLLVQGILQSKRLQRVSLKKNLVMAGVVLNIGLLCYFKYAGLFAETLNSTLNTNFFINTFFPWGWSFYTFQQIILLLDVANDQTERVSFLTHLQFNTFFPYLASGPISRFRDLAPQFEKGGEASVPLIGVTIFFIGLFKKLIFADHAAIFADSIFASLSLGNQLGVIESWLGAFAYSFQLYFDFSGYSDMAIGSAYLLGFRLPVNFNSPFRATSLIDFWRRWHMTLSSLIMAFVFTPLATLMSRKVNKFPKSLRTFISLGIPGMFTFIIVGAWHGEKWPIILFGMIHGLFFTLNLKWKKFKNQFATFLWVVVTLAIFRAEDMHSVGLILKGLLFQNGIHTTPDFFAFERIAWIFGLWIICWFAPNTREIMGAHYPALTHEMLPNKDWAKPYLQWRPTYLGIVFSILITISAILALGNSRSFLYFKF